MISSRPIQSFLSFARFSKIKLLPFTKAQALECIDKCDFRPDQPEIQKKFHATLNKGLYKTHKNFAQNPLLLTIMLLTFDQFAEVPSKMHVFYREAFLALSVTHDATKSAFKRALKTKLSIDEVSAYFAEICFRSYRDEKYEFTDGEFADYFGKLARADKSIAASDFLYDICYNLCLVYEEGGKYHFIHRSFQEYFAAVFMSKQNDKFISRLGGFFESRWPREFTNSAFPMLYDIIPERVEEFVFVPYLTELFAKCDASDGYWTFLEEEYPTIYYEIGEVDEYADNDPQSYVLEFVLNHLEYRDTLTPCDLPYYDSLVDEEVSADKATFMVLDMRGGKGAEAEWERKKIWPDYTPGEGEELNVSGYKLSFKAAMVRKYPQLYSELLSYLEQNDFIFMYEYQALRAYLMTLTDKIQERGDDLNDLL